MAGAELCVLLKARKLHSSNRKAADNNTTDRSAQSKERPSQRESKPIARPSGCRAVANGANERINHAWFDETLNNLKTEV